MVPFVAQRPAMQLAEALDLGRIGPQDPAVWGLRVAAGGDPAATAPVVESDLRHPNRLGQLAQPPFVAAQ